MEFEIKKEVFLHYLNQIQKIIPYKTFFPVYCYIKMTIKENVLFLEGNNANFVVKIKIEDKSLKTKEEGSLVLLGKNFFDIVKKIDFNFVKISSLEDKFLIIKTDYSRYKLKLIELNNFPLNNFVFDYDNFFEIKTDLFKRIIEEIIIVTSKEKQKNVLTGVNLTYRSSSLIASATDSFRLGQKKIDLDINCSDFDIIIPGKSLEELLKLLEQQKDDMVKISITKKNFFLKTNSLDFQSSLLEGSYPQINLSKKNNLFNFFKINKNNLIKILERVSLFLPKDRIFLDNVVEFIIDKSKKIKIFSNSEEIGNALEEIETSEILINEQTNVFFNIKHLEEILKIFPSEEITFSFENSFKPFLIASEEEKTILYLISPFYMK
ncbi:DNA polymerase III subunit beta ['Camptotheca acuminata' phytoplasma]|uniref:DNA polymerase III subunit beta n=1 Tax='Camptotheca acuminata' phytoplasma TaxID=3239192 RepID=UPI00351A11D9